MSLTNEFRDVIAELLTTFGGVSRYEDVDGKKINGTGVFENKKIKDEAGAYIYQETNTFYIQLPKSKVTSIKPGEFITTNNKEYVVTNVINASTLDDKAFIVFKLELQK